MAAGSLPDALALRWTFKAAQPVKSSAAIADGRVFVGCDDGRLYALAAGKLQQNPQSGHLFLFANKRRDRMKILFFDGSSLWVCARRMEKGRLHWPSSEDGRAQLTREEFALLIGGIDLTSTTKRKWYRRTVAEEDNSSRTVA